MNAAEPMAAVWIDYSTTKTIETASGFLKRHAPRQARRHGVTPVPRALGRGGEARPCGIEAGSREADRIMPAGPRLCPFVKLLAGWRRRTQASQAPAMVRGSDAVSVRRTVPSGPK